MTLILRVLVLVLLGISAGLSSEQSRPKRFIFPISLVKPVVAIPARTAVFAPAPAVVVAPATVTTATGTTVDEAARQNGAQAGFLPGALSLFSSIISNPGPLLPFIPAIAPAIASGIGTGIVNTLTHPNFSLPALVLPAPIVKTIVPVPVVKTVVPAPIVTAPLITKTVIPIVPPPVVIPAPIITKTVVPVTPVVKPVVVSAVVGKRRRRSAPSQPLEDGPFSGLTKLVLSRPELQSLTPIVFNIPPSERPTNVNIVQKLSDASTDNTHTLTAHTSFKSSSGQRQGDLLIDSLRHGTSQITSSLGEDFQKDSFVVRHHTYDVYHTDEKHDENVDNNRYFVTNIYVTKPDDEVIPQDNVKPVSKPPRPPPKVDYIEKPIEIAEEEAEKLPEIHIIDSVPDKQEIVPDSHKAPIGNEATSPPKASSSQVDNPYQHDRFFTTEVDLKSLGVPTLSDLVSSGSEPVAVIASPSETLSSPRTGARGGSWFEPLKKELDEVYTGASRGASEAEGEVNALNRDLVGLQKELGGVAVDGFGGGSGQDSFQGGSGHHHDCPHHPGHPHGVHDTHMHETTTRKPARPTHQTTTHETTRPTHMTKPTRPTHTTTHRPQITLPTQMPKPPRPSHTHGTTPRTPKPTTSKPTHGTTRPTHTSKPSGPTSTARPTHTKKPTPPTHVTKPTRPTHMPSTTSSIRTTKPTRPGHSHGTSPPTHGTKPTRPSHTPGTSSPTHTKKPTLPGPTHATTVPTHPTKPTRPGHTHQTKPTTRKPPSHMHETASRPTHGSHKPTNDSRESTKPEHLHELTDSAQPNESVESNESGHGSHTHGAKRPHHSHGSNHKGHSHGSKHPHDSHQSTHKPKTSQSDQTLGFFLLDDSTNYNSDKKSTSPNPDQNSGFINSDDTIDFAGTELKPNFVSLDQNLGSTNFEQTGLNNLELNFDKTWENIGQEHPPTYEPVDFYYVWKEKQSRDEKTPKNIFLPKQTNPIEFNSRQAKKVHNLQEQPDNGVANRKTPKVVRTFTITSRPPVSPGTRAGFERSREDLYKTVGEIPLESHPLDRPIVSAFDSYGLPARVKK